MLKKIKIIFIKASGLLFISCNSHFSKDFCNDKRGLLINGYVKEAVDSFPKDLVNMISIFVPNDNHLTKDINKKEEKSLDNSSDLKNLGSLKVYDSITIKHYSNNCSEYVEEGDYEISSIEKNKNKTYTLVINKIRKSEKDEEKSFRINVFEEKETNYFLGLGHIKEEEINNTDTSYPAKYDYYNIEICRNTKKKPVLRRSLLNKYF